MGQLKVYDPANGWTPIPIIGPQGVSGPTGPTGVQGPESDELYVGNTAPTGPQTDVWYDPDAPPPPPAQLIPYAPLQVKVVNSFSGPWDLEGSADTIITGLIPGQLYLLTASCTGMGTTTGMKYIDCAVDGVNMTACPLWINTINVHHAFMTNSVAWRATAESHTIGFRSGSGAPLADGNDKGMITLIPMAG